MPLDTRGGILTHPAAIAVSAVIWIASLVYTGWQARGAEEKIATAIAVLQSKIEDVGSRLDKIENRLDRYK